MTRKLYTCVFIRKEKQVLLGLKKKGFGEGKWEGFGGKVQPDETVLQAALREVKEECSLDPEDLHEVGFIEFEFEDDTGLLELHIFVTDKFQGELEESEEMRPQWFDEEKIPYEEMWPDSIHWFPYMLRKEPFKGHFLYKGFDYIVKHKLEKISEQASKDKTDKL